MSHSCTASDGSFADPAVRVGAWVQTFGANGLLVPICPDSYAPSFDRIAQLLNTSVRHTVTVSACIRLAALALAGAALAASAGCGTRTLTANASGTGGTGVIAFDARPGTDGSFQPTRDVDILFMIDNTAGRAGAGQPAEELSDLHHDPERPRRRPPQPPHRGDHVRPGRGRRIDRGLRRRRRRRRHIPVHRARDLHDERTWILAPRSSPTSTA